MMIHLYVHTVILVATIVLIIAVFVLKRLSHSQLSVPSVSGSWPIVGNILQFDRQRPDKTLLEWSRQLGPIYKVQILHETWVIVCGYDEMHEMLVTKGHSFAGRKRATRRNYRRFLAETITCGNKDILNSDSTQPHWMPLKKAAYRGIRHYGDGLTRLETTLCVTATEFVQKVTSYEGKMVNLKEDIHNFVVKVCMN